jgi:hypothetical protein
LKIGFSTINAVAETVDTKLVFWERFNVADLLPLAILESRC